MNANRMTGGTAGSVRHHGEFTANLMQHEDWQREALQRSELRRALQPGGDGPSPGEPVAARRVTAAIGGALIRLGTRLQGQPRPAAPTPAR